MERKERHTNRHPSCGGVKIHRIKNIAVTLRRMNQEEISSDVLGSYTGTAKKQEIPEQDADAL